MTTPAQLQVQIDSVFHLVGHDRVTAPELATILEMATSILQDHADTLPTQTGFEIEANENLLAGMAVYTNVSGKLVKAQANSMANATGVVILGEDTPLGVAGRIATAVLELSNWTAATGSTLLTPKASYYLSPSTPGMLTTTVPDTSSQVILWLGQALTTEVLLLVRSQAILL
jgi:hypothetical protein